MKPAFQAEAYSDWSGQLLVTVSHFIGPPLFYEVLGSGPDRHPDHNQLQTTTIPTPNN